MKVVLFCGGLGTRLREHSETIPKPMVTIGYRPLLWHLMKYYAHFGHTDFILCLGYRGDVIKRYFLDYDDCLSNDFELSGRGRSVRLFGRDIDGWRITFAETGLHSNIGQRLRAVQRYLGDDPEFLANYSDGLSDLPLDEYLDHVRRQDRIASFVSVSPHHGTSQSFHVVSSGADGLVRDLRPVSLSGLQMNGGFFAFKREIFEYLEDGEELVEQPFQRLIARRQLAAYSHKGFWAAMDTLKDKHMFDEMHARGETPWAVWNSASDPWRRQAPEPVASHR
jgi:glucose-1-phosphate cytidylyltransferase